MNGDEEIDRLIDELGLAAAAAPDETGAEAASLQGWLARLVGRRGSELLLVAGAPLSARIDGQVVPMEGTPLDGQDVEAAVIPALPAHARRAYKERGIADASYRIHGLGRFRINLHRERGRAAATIRALPTRPPRLGELNLPATVETLTHLPRGLVLVGGPTGSGKSTTLAAFVDEINRRERRHIVTIEDPIEFEHPHRLSLVEQVEIGIDAPDFPTALRAAVRQAPDVIVVGEMRDPETMQIALAAAETGHLVLSTVHTGDVTSSLARISDSFPLERQPTVRQDLAIALAAVLVQTLLPRRGGGRVPAAELLVADYGARQHIRKYQLQHLHQEITMSRRLGSFTYEDCLADLVRRGLIEREDALARAGHREELEHILRTA
jgi:twitching motility protein PilT